AYLDKKDDCKDLKYFEQLIKKRITENYDCDYFIEGHFHQNKIIKLDKLEYINLGAFACNQRYFIVKSIKYKEFLEENSFSKEI
ncbi:MAG: UDP-2,3-diacylglucosamine hydrolase, partial [Sulfurimonas sp.]|nr:UDP-2,3-diacylglucosamine hydrolase [Sulfurimonas sp.]